MICIYIPINPILYTRIINNHLAIKHTPSFYHLIPALYHQYTINRNSSMYTWLIIKSWKLITDIYIASNRVSVYHWPIHAFHIIYNYIHLNHSYMICASSPTSGFGGYLGSLAPQMSRDHHHPSKQLPQYQWLNMCKLFTYIKYHHITYTLGIPPIL